MKVPIPPPDEQAAIVRFLAALDRRVNRFVRAKRRLIDLLTEQKQAIITHAVTRGLDPNAKLKPSGIDWLGEVPEAWKVVQLRRLVQAGRNVTYGIVQPGPYVDGGRPMVRAQDYSFGWADPKAVYHVAPEIEEPYRRSRLKAKDIIYTIVGQGSVGNVAMVPPEFDGANITQTTARISIDDKLASPDFVFAVLSSLIGERQLRSYVKGVGQPGINLGHLKLYWIPLPPRDAQSRIAEHLAAATASADHVVAVAEREIALIREYRTRLVADVVTGKLDVRAAAARLPEDDWEAAEPVEETIEPDDEDALDIAEYAAEELADVEA